MPPSQHTSAYVSIRQRKNLWGWSKMNATQARQLSELPQSHRHLRIHVVHRTLHTHIKTHSNSHTTHPRTYTKYVHSRDATGPRQATRTEQAGLGFTVLLWASLVRERTCEETFGMITFGIMPNVS